LGLAWSIFGLFLSLSAFAVTFMIPYWLALWMNNTDANQYQFFFNIFLVMGGFAILAKCKILLMQFSKKLARD
jgi:hypothetical protein